MAQKNIYFDGQTYPLWATEEAMENIANILQKSNKDQTKSLEEIKKALKPLEKMASSGGLDPKSIKNVNEEFSDLAKSLRDIEAGNRDVVDSAEDRKKAESEAVDTVKNLNKARRQGSVAVGAMNKSMEKTAGVFEWSGNAVKGASNQLKSSLNQSASKVTSFVDRIGDSLGGGGAATIMGPIGAMVGYQVQLLSESISSYRTGLLSDMQGQRQTMNQFVDQAARLGVGVDQINEVFSESAKGLRTQNFQDFASAARKSTLELTSMGFSLRDTTDLLSDELQARTRYGIFERMSQQQMINATNNAAKTTNHFAQILGKSRDEIQQQGNEFVDSTQMQYQLMQRFSDTALANAEHNMRNLGKVFADASPEFRSQIRDFFSTSVPQDSQLRKNLMGTGNEKIADRLMELRGTLGQRKFTGKEYEKMIQEATKGMNFQAYADRIEESSNVLNQLRDTMVGFRLTGEQFRASDDEKAVGPADAETQTAVDFRNTIDVLTSEIKKGLATDESMRKAIISMSSTVNDNLPKLTQGINFLSENIWKILGVYGGYKMFGGMIGKGLGRTGGGLMRRMRGGGAGQMGRMSGLGRLAGRVAGPIALAITTIDGVRGSMENINSNVENYKTNTNKAIARMYSSLTGTIGGIVGGLVSIINPKWGESIKQKIFDVDEWLTEKSIGFLSWTKSNLTFDGIKDNVSHFLSWTKSNLTFDGIKDNVSHFLTWTKSNLTFDGIKDNVSHFLSWTKSNLTFDGIKDNVSHFLTWTKSNLTFDGIKENMNKAWSKFDKLPSLMEQFATRMWNSVKDGSAWDKTMSLFESSSDAMVNQAQGWWNKIAGGLGFSEQKTQQHQPKSQEEYRKMWENTKGWLNNVKGSFTPDSDNAREANKTTQSEIETAQQKRKVMDDFVQEQVQDIDKEDYMKYAYEELIRIREYMRKLSRNDGFHSMA